LLYVREPIIHAPIFLRQDRHLGDFGSNAAELSILFVIIVVVSHWLPQIPRRLCPRVLRFVSAWLPRPQSLPALAQGRCDRSGQGTPLVVRQAVAARDNAARRSRHSIGDARLRLCVWSLQDWLCPTPCGLQPGDRPPYSRCRA